MNVVIDYADQGWNTGETMMLVIAIGLLAIGILGIIVGVVAESVFGAAWSFTACTAGFLMLATYYSFWSNNLWDTITPLIIASTFGIFGSLFFVVSIKEHEDQANNLARLEKQNRKLRKKLARYRDPQI